MNFIGLFSNLYQLRTAFNRVTESYIHVCFHPRSNTQEILSHLNSKMAPLLYDECRKALTSMGHHRRFMQRREGENTLLLYLEESKEGITGSLFIVKHKLAQKIYDNVTAYSVLNAAGGNSYDRFDIENYVSHSIGYIHRRTIRSDDFSAVYDSPLLKGGLDTCIQNPVTIGKQWCSVVRVLDQQGSEIVNHVKLGFDGVKYHRIIHEMTSEQYDLVVDELIRGKRD